MDNVEYFECICNSDEHRLVFNLFDWNVDNNGKIVEKYITEDNVELYLSVFLSNDGFWNRLWKGIKYIFGYKSKYGHFGNWNLNPKDIDRLIEYLNKYKELRSQYYWKLCQDHLSLQSQKE